jgi:transcriptional regulator with XRE-family HTH domain
VNEGLTEPLLKALGRRIRELRTERGYSQEGFADKCGVHRTFMGTIERGESNLSFQNIVKVTAALDVTLSALFAGLEAKAQIASPPHATAAGRKREKAKRRPTAK